MNLAQLIQSQNFALLMQALGNAGDLTAGQTVPARLLALEPDGTATAAIGDIKVSLVLAGPQARQAALQPGATLMLHLEAPEQPGGDLRATVVDIRPPDATPNAATGAATSNPVAPGTPIFGMASNAPSGTLPTPVLTPSPTQGAGMPAAPKVLSAGQTVEAAPVGQPLARPGAVAAAVGNPTPLRATPGDPSTLAPVASPRALIGPMLGAALQRQDSMAPLFANLRGLIEGALALALPKPMLAAADRVLAQAFPVERAVLTGPKLQDALKSSGLFMEANAAAGRPAPAAGDLKAALLALSEALQPVIDAMSPAPQAARQPPVAGATTDQSEAPSPPPPPRRDGPLAPQPPAERTLVPGDPPLAIASALLNQTDAALDRIKLTQYASLPLDAARPESAQAAPQRWLAEVPLAFQQGIATLPLQVERDPPRRTVEGVVPPIWRIRFALDVEPMGPLQGVVTLQGRAVGVTLWAERENTGQLLRGAAPGLESALLHADFGSGAVDVHTGRPKAVQPTAGQFLDRLS